MWGSSVEQNGQRPSKSLNYSSCVVLLWLFFNTLNNNHQLCSVGIIAASLGGEQNKKKKKHMNLLKIESMLLHHLLSSQPLSLSCCMKSCGCISCALLFWSGLHGSNWYTPLPTVCAAQEWFFLVSKRDIRSTQTYFYRLSTFSKECREILSMQCHCCAFSSLYFHCDMHDLPNSALVISKLL